MGGLLKMGGLFNSVRKLQVRREKVRKLPKLLIAMFVI